jgi:hypothetical protein
MLGTSVAYSNAHRFWNDPGVMKGMWDLRNSFKATPCRSGALGW